MLPFIISKTKLLQIKRQKPKEQKPKTVQIKEDKSKDRYEDILNKSKSKRVKRKPLRIPPTITTTPCDCTFTHVTKIVVNFTPKSRKRGASNIVLSMTTWGTTGQHKRIKLPSVKIQKKLIKKDTNVTYDSGDFFKKLEVFNFFTKN